jgi:hypothetical protein
MTTNHSSGRAATAAPILPTASSSEISALLPAPPNGVGKPCPRWWPLLHFASFYCACDIQCVAVAVVALDDQRHVRHGKYAVLAGPIRWLSPVPDLESLISSAPPSTPQKGRSQIPDARQCARKAGQIQRRAEHNLPRSILHEIAHGDRSIASFLPPSLSAHMYF